MVCRSNSNTRDGSEVIRFSTDSILQSLRKCVLTTSPLGTLTDCLTVFISEITARAFIIADSNKRRTLSRSDISKALSKSDQFDFLIDIVPREELPFPATTASATWKKNQGAASMHAKPVNTAFFYPPPYLYLKYPPQGPTPGPGDSPSNPLELDSVEGPTGITSGSQVLEQVSYSVVSRVISVVNWDFAA